MGREEVPDSIEHHIGLKKLNLRNSKVNNVSSNISKLESLRELDLSNCRSLKSLSEPPRYLWLLHASHCTSLEKVSFTDHNLYRFDFFKDGDGDGDEQVYLLFCDCKSLNQDSIKSIEANAVFQIQSIAQRWARREEGRIKRTGRRGQDYNRIFCRNQLFCCFPGNEIAAHEFEHRSVNSSLTLKLAPNECSGSRFLAFAVSLVADITLGNQYVVFFCNYQLRAAGGRKFSGRCSIGDKNPCAYEGDDATILFSENLITIDDAYEEASFEFHIDNDCIMVEECGVHVFYVGMEAELSTLRLQAHPRRKAADSAIPMPFGTGSRLFFCAFRASKVA